jgi:hypothetical protein
MAKNGNKSKKGGIILKVSENDPTLGYVYLPNHLSTFVDKTISLFDLIGPYKGPSIYLDFKDEELVGIEIVP